MRGTLLVCAAVFAPSVLAAPRYPVTANLRFDQPREVCVPIAERNECGAVAAAQDAFRAKFAQLFQPGGANANLDFTLTVESARQLSVMNGEEVEIAVRLYATSVEKEALGEIRSTGAGVLSGDDSKAYAAAFTRAAADAARAFEVGLPGSSLREWMIQRGLIPVVVVPPRSDSQLALALGAGAVEGGDRQWSAGFAAEVVGRKKWLSVAVGLSHYAPGFMGAEPQRLANFGPQGEPCSFDTWDLALEPGVSFRLAPALDLRLSPGIHLLAGSASANGSSSSSSFSMLGYSAGASLTYAFWGAGSGARWLAGLSARLYFASSADLPGLSRKVPVADDSFILFLGREWQL
jgi:hypothetical protein